MAADHPAPSHDASDEEEPILQAYEALQRAKELLRKTDPRQRLSQLDEAKKDNEADLLMLDQALDSVRLRHQQASDDMQHLDGQIMVLHHQIKELQARRDEKDAECRQFVRGEEGYLADRERCLRLAERLDSKRSRLSELAENSLLPSWGWQPEVTSWPNSTPAGNAPRCSGEREQRVDL
jgi:predicted RNase H-like nuclease (RuvC/YqgF family)